MEKNHKNYFFFKNFLILLIVFLLILLNNYKKKYKNSKISEKTNYNKKFIVFIRKVKKSTGGLLAYYFVNVGCVNYYISKGYIPLIDLISHPNIFNGFNTNITYNPWEIFFEQPFKYTLNNVKNKAKKTIEYVQCYGVKNHPYFNIFYNNKIREYWHRVAKQYIPIKTEIIKEANYKFKLLFNDSINILGILIRGTDYIAKKPSHHAIQPSPEMVFEDIQKMDKKNKYKWIFITTEDELIREKFINKFGKKLKYIKSKTDIKYNYKKKELLAFNEKIKGNIEFMKIYLINIIILSKCLDIIASRTAGSIVAFILTNGFRNKKIYNLGYYK
jgi:hypothetical protein